MRTSTPRRGDRLLSGPPLAALALAVVLIGCGHPGGPAAASGAAAAPAALAVAPVHFAGLDDLRAEMKGRQEAGRPVLVNFWATWCQPCVEELPELQGLAREWSASGPEVIGVSLDAWVYADGAEAESKVRETLAQSGVTYVNLIYRGDQDPLLDGFHMPGPIPFSVLYDQKGKRIAEYVGPIDADELHRDAGHLLKPAAARASTPTGS